ncbi:MAG: CRISPR-associated endonuclease Cas6 [Proteobacteria bacterium]|nr:CRISPR-associated endonuclease Cas6 [Pseudomonadota bacterium]
MYGICQKKIEIILIIGFPGKFSVNYEIPDYWRIGKSVSRGFGTVKRVRDEDNGKKDPIERMNS